MSWLYYVLWPIFFQFIPKIIPRDENYICFKEKKTGPQSDWILHPDLLLVSAKVQALVFMPWNICFPRCSLSLWTSLLNMNGGSITRKLFPQSNRGIASQLVSRYISMIFMSINKLSIEWSIQNLARTNLGK